MLCNVVICVKSVGDTTDCAFHEFCDTLDSKRGVFSLADSIPKEEGGELLLSDNLW